MVDDDKDDCLIVKHAASRVSLNLNIRFFYSGQELLDYFEKAILEGSDDDYPDLIMLDLNMPRLGGKEVLQSLKQHAELSHIPIVIYTTSDSYYERKQCQSLGAAEYMVKPNTLPEIEKRLITLYGLARKG